MVILSKADDSIIQVLCNEGRLEQAVDVLCRMSTPPFIDTYLSLLKACNKTRALYQAKKVHVHLAKHIQHLSGYLGDYLVMTLARCGAVEDALETSHALPHRTVFSWTAVISAHAERGQGLEALKLYKCMKEDGVKPNHYTFVALLKACGNVADLEKVQTLHHDICRLGLGADVYILTTLISVYGKCGSIEEAENVFSLMMRHDVVTWNSMLAAYVEQGLASKALKLLRQIHEERVRLDELMFVGALQACVILAEKEGDSMKSIALKVGMALHADARRTGFSSGPFILTTLVNMYSKCGRLEGAECLISTKWSQCTNVILNALIAAYFEHNQERKSLQLYKFIREQGMNIDEYTFASALQACGALAEKEQALDLDGVPLKLMTLELGKALHADAQRWTLLSDTFVCNTLLNIYGRCGAIAEAESLFCKLLDRDIVSWNSLMSAYVEHCQGEKALLLYKQMREEMISPEQLTIVIVLQACGQLAEKENWAIIDREHIKVMSLDIGLELHADARDRSFENDVVVGDSLLRMYTKCGAIVHAEDVFTSLRSQLNVRFWTAMLSAYVEHDYEVKALQLYVQMYKEGISPDHHTYVIAILACGILAENEEGISSQGRFVKVKSLEIGIALHAGAQRRCFAWDIFINNTLVSMYAKCGALAEAENVFIGMAHRDEVSWNALLSAYSAHIEKGKSVLQLYPQMLAESDIGQWTFVVALQACTNLLEAKLKACEKGYTAYPLEIGLALYCDAKKNGFSSDVAITNNLLCMYGKSGNLQEAEAIFNDMHQRDGVSWTVLMYAYLEQGNIERFLELYQQMQVENVLFDNVLLIYILRACSDMGSLEICRQHHFTMTSHALDWAPSLAVSLIHTYGNCASTADARAAFNGLYLLDIAAWNACIASYAGEGDCETTMRTLEELCLAGKEPNQVSFASALNACARAGLALLGLKNFCYMIEECGTKPGLMHYSILVDLLGRSGCFARAENMLEKMAIQGDVTMWISLLGCCRTHGNLEVGERAFDHAVSLQPGHSGAYVMLSNLYIEAGQLNLKEVG